MLTFKLYFGADDIRRISFPEKEDEPTPSWSHFLKQLAEIHPKSPNKELKVQYIDEEGDKCTVSSQVEWESMFQILPSQRLIKLYLTESPSLTVPRRGMLKPAEINNNNNGRRTRVCARRNPQQALSSDGTQQKQPQRPQSSHPRLCQPRMRSQCNLYWLHRQAYDNIGQTKTKEELDVARMCLNRILEITPIDGIALYNLACVDSLLGNLDDAMDHLEKSIRDGGYTNFAHMQEDSDLDNLRQLVRFKALFPAGNNGAQEQQPSNKEDEAKKEEEVKEQEKKDEEEKKQELKQQEVKEEQNRPEVKISDDEDEDLVVRVDQEEDEEGEADVKQEDKTKDENKEEEQEIYPAELMKLTAMGFDKDLCRYLLNISLGNLEVVLNRILE